MTLAAPPEAFAPLQLPWQLRLTPEQFEQVCQANPGAGRTPVGGASVPPALPGSPRDLAVLIGLHTLQPLWGYPNPLLQHG
jgi:hypothetical protein